MIIVSAEVTAAAVFIRVPPTRNISVRNLRTNFGPMCAKMSSTRATRSVRDGRTQTSDQDPLRGSRDMSAAQHRALDPVRADRRWPDQGCEDRPPHIDPARRAGALRRLAAQQDWRGRLTTPKTSKAGEEDPGARCQPQPKALLS